nr:myosin essential light chain striated adductor [Hymenolepis microstoma]
MANLSKAEVDDVREVFEVFDFWDGCDGMVDASRVPDLLRCTGLNPTNACCLRNGALTTAGEVQYTFEEFLSVYQAIKYESLPPLKDQFMQVFKSYDRESQGILTVAQIRHILETCGERLNEEETDRVLKQLGYQHGIVKYEEFIDCILEETTESAFSGY